MAGHGDAQRIINVIRQAIGQETKAGAKIDYAVGVVAATYGNYADVYLHGNVTNASQGFRVPADVYVNVGDSVVVAIDYGSNIGKVVKEVIPRNTYALLSVNPNSGELYLSEDGEEAPDGGVFRDLIWNGTENVFEENEDGEDEFLWR